MLNLSLNDATQRQILPHLRITERLLARIVSRLSRKEKSAEIIAMPDLGLPLNVTRICGGFFTGAFYSWETDVPFVPVDATINSCGVSVFRLNDVFDDQAHFDAVVASSIEKKRSDSFYEWNFDSGNHFITYAKKVGQAEEYFAILHASAAEWKKQKHGLYPTQGNWYWRDIHVENGENGRYLRYIDGKIAEQFIDHAQKLDRTNRQRLTYFAEQVFGDNIEEVMHQPHYGMPTRQSVAIGCQWQPHPYLWLTAPDCPLFLISPEIEGQNRFCHDAQDLVLTPHGLGLQLHSNAVFHLDSDGITVNDQKFTTGMTLAHFPLLQIRASDSVQEISMALQSVLQQCPGQVTGVLQPIHSYHKKMPLIQA